jgi:hypothetical protein
MIVPELNGTELGSAEWPDDHWPFLLACREELLDHEYGMYPHGERNTYARGCTGPMCKRANRLYTRKVRRDQPVRENVTLLSRFDEFLVAYTQYAAEEYKRSGQERPRRRKLREVRTIRREHTVPMSTARKLHNSRARLAS